MAQRIEVSAKEQDARADVLQKRLQQAGFFNITSLRLVDVYTINADLSGQQLEDVTRMLINPVIQQAALEPQMPAEFTWAVEIGYRPAVTDNAGTTAREGIEDLVEITFFTQGVYSSQLLFLAGEIPREEVSAIAASLANPLIQQVQIKSREQYQAEGGMNLVIPQPQLNSSPQADLVDILNAGDEELSVMGKQGIANADGSRRGPLALHLTYMKAIQTYFRTKGRNPTDVELESIAQTWSEHCKHTIFADSIDDIQEGLFRRYIQEPTRQIQEMRSGKDFCVSVFTDNSGAIIFDEQYLLTMKVETHNSPSALDPFGGAITGIVGVNRDTLGFGLGAKPVMNLYGFCFGDPRDTSALYRDTAKTQKMLPPRRIMEGVIEGVKVGGNCSGIPTPQGFLFFDELYRGKPLVFVGTLGLIPTESAGRPSHQKKAQSGDYIVMAGGGVGLDGIHGATFSSEAMDTGSPATAVQIGDPITQKKMSDALIKEARDVGLYNSITDNGAGGLSCSIAEMARESDGCYVQLDNVPLKYAGVAPWQIWISESQERMTLAVPQDKWTQFSDLMQRRGVEARVIGQFTNSGKCVVECSRKTVMDVDLEFLHNGLPPRPMTTSYTKVSHEEPELPNLNDLTPTLHTMIGRLNIASHEFISQQYDHEVQGGSVIKPLQGRGRVNGDATVIRPLLSSPRGVVVAQGINPTYSDIDTYHMAAAAIDTAIRNAIAAGANVNHLALMDNFCWCSSNDPERLGELKEAARACADYAIVYKTPFVSGKDSMFNDFKGYDEEERPIKISVPPTLLITAVGVMPDVRKATSLDAKFPGDFIYIVGETHDELGGSEYFALLGEQQRGQPFIGRKVPRVDANKNRNIYAAVAQCIDEELIASAQSIHRGGLAIALAKTAMGGELGMNVSLEHLPGTVTRDDAALFSESQGRIVVTVSPEHQQRFEEVMSGNSFGLLGSVQHDSFLRLQGRSGQEIIQTTVDSLLNFYKLTFRGF